MTPPGAEYPLPTDLTPLSFPTCNRDSHTCCTLAVPEVFPRMRPEAFCVGRLQQNRKPRVTKQVKERL